jgi:hypothetical protein
MQKEDKASHLIMIKQNMGRPISRWACKNDFLEAR